MAILITDAQFTMNGAPLASNTIYVDTMSIRTGGTVEVRLYAYAFEEGQITSGILPIDGLGTVTFPVSEIAGENYWADINEGNIHDKAITTLEERKPEWAGKVSKTTPIE